eukprot:snap_masked-scaffold_5-processed-gene-13.35-mRNA-1 protein AED:1.00 eAED:1.00 QI:0/-1/0/0/-1/1/1/0/225
MSKSLIFVLGRKLYNGMTAPPVLLSRLHKALELYKSFQDDKPLLFLSGGKVLLDQDEQERAGEFQRIKQIKSESEVMKEHVLSQEPSANVVEDASAKHTIENVIHLLHFALDNDMEQIYIVNSDFHMQRTKLIFEKLVLLRQCRVELKFVTVDDTHLLTAKERERESVVEPGMIERLDLHIIFYKEYYLSKSGLEEARHNFFGGNSPHSSVYKQEYHERENTILQ